MKYVGKFYKCHYRRPYIGVCLDYNDLSVPYKLGIIVTLLIVRDSHGNVPRKRIVRKLHISWLEEVDKFDVSYINPDWFKF